MSKITLPPLPAMGYGNDGYSVEALKADRIMVAEHVIRACADLCAAEQAENRDLAKGSKTAMYDWMADGAGLCRGAILALLEPKE